MHEIINIKIIYLHIYLFMYLLIHHSVSIKQTNVYSSNHFLFTYITFRALYLKNISSGFYLLNAFFELLYYIKFFSNYGYYLKIIYIPEPLNTSNAETSSSNFILKHSTTNNNSISSPPFESFVASKLFNKFPEFPSFYETPTFTSCL